MEESRFTDWRDWDTWEELEPLALAGYVFRGQGSADWSLESSLDRLARTCGGIETSEHLGTFRRASLEHLGAALELEDDVIWAIGQHAGLATPLLDWTSSPWIAAFFAFASAAPVPQSEHRAIFALRQDAITRKSDELLLERVAGTVDFVAPVSPDNPRMLRQSGLFTRLPSETDLEGWLRANFPADTGERILVRMLVPSADRATALRSLNLKNLNYQTLFPDMAGASLHTNTLSTLARLA